MNQKYKITSVSEPSNALEEQRARDSKDFNRAIIRLVASTCTEIIGTVLMPFAMQYSSVAAAFSATLIMVSGRVQYKAITTLHSLYDKKGNEEILDKENDLGGKTR